MGGVIRRRCGRCNSPYRRYPGGRLGGVLLVVFWVSTLIKIRQLLGGVLLVVFWGLYFRTVEIWQLLGRGSTVGRDYYTSHTGDVTVE